MTLMPAHGFVWPAGLPSCIMCDRDANDPLHITPARGDLMPILAGDKRSANMPVRSHAYMMSVPQIAQQVTCQVCGGSLRDSAHPAGAPSGAMPRARAEATTLHTERAFVTEIGNRLVFAAPATTEFTADSLPREVAADWQRASEQNPNNVWIAGRYVEADRPNRNAAYWSTADLELGEPSVSHGPINWLHEERHIIGAIASSQMVHVEREAAAETGVGNHIAVLGAVWPYIYPQESQLIQKASENGKLWASMECVSKEVACLTCDRTLAYREYMKQEARCDHMLGGMPRRFVDPTFGGAGIIVPPVRPGWANADMRVLMPEAASIAERQAASFGDLPTSEAELLVAQIISHHTDGIDA
jgi:hypothetical protein